MPGCSCCNTASEVTAAAHEGAAMNINHHDFEFYIEPCRTALQWFK